MSTKRQSDGIAEEYDFSAGERGRLAKRLEDGYDVVIDGDEDNATHVPATQVRAAQATLESRKRQAVRNRDKIASITSDEEV